VKGGFVFVVVLFVCLFVLWNWPYAKKQTSTLELFEKKPCTQQLLSFLLFGFILG